jgi:hypothetical protein
MCATYQRMGDRFPCADRISRLIDCVDAGSADAGPKNPVFPGLISLIIAAFLRGPSGDQWAPIARYFKGLERNKGDICHN